MHLQRDSRLLLSDLVDKEKRAAVKTSPPRARTIRTEGGDAGVREASITMKGNELRINARCLCEPLC
jgi:hypothetical protein